MVKIEVNPHTGVLTLNIDAPLASANVRTLSDHATAEVRRAGVLRGMIIKAPQFPAWRDMADFLGNLRFIREHGDTIARIAVITESSPMSFAAQLARMFPQAGIERFAAHSLERAESWVASEPAVVTEPKGIEPASESMDAVDDADADSAAVVELDDIETESGDEDDWFVKT